MSEIIDYHQESDMAMTAIHPGQHLAEELEMLCMSAASLARQLGVPTNRVTEILNGQRAITGDTALRLGHFFGTSAAFWLNLESLYELRVAERKASKSDQGSADVEAAKTGPAGVLGRVARHLEQTVKRSGESCYWSERFRLTLTGTRVLLKLPPSP